MEQPFLWYLGIDWGSEAHQVCLIDAAGGAREERRVEHAAPAVQACLAWVLERTGTNPGQIAVAIEVPRGALVDTFLERGFPVFAINPKQLDRFRDRHTAAGAKDDRRDALVLGDSLRTDPGAFRRVAVDDPLIIQLREWARAEEDLDRERRALTNRLRDQVYRVAPALLPLCPAADEPWFWTLLEHAPTPAEQRALTGGRVGQLLREHRIRRLDADQVLPRLRAAAFSLAPGVVEATAAHIRLLLPRLRLVHAQRATCTKQTEALLQALRDRPGAEPEPREHRDIAILESLPGVGRKTTIAMLTEAAEPLAQRAYHSLRTRMGAAPVTKASGKRRVVLMRYACNRRLRGAAYHWGRVALQRDPASAAYYARLRARGHAHGRALRSVVDRLLRILIAMLREGSLYDPNRGAVPTAA